MASGGFAVLVAVDFQQGKMNYELTFPCRPSIPQLRDRIQFDIGAEASLRRPGQPFEVYRAQVFDERLQMWVDLMSAGQLEHYCQVYVFQKESAGAARDKPGRIPPPVKPAAASGGAYGDPQPAAGAYPAPQGVSPGSAAGQQRSEDYAAYGDPYAPPGAEPAGYTASAAAQPMGYDPMTPPRTRAAQQSPQQVAESRFPQDAPPQERARISYAALCGAPGAHSQGATRENWQKGMEGLKLAGEGTAFTPETSNDLFDKADTNGDGVVSAMEWQNFCQRYPKMLDGVYFRARDAAAEEARKAELEQARQRKEAVEKALEDAKLAVEQAADDVGGKEQQAQDADAQVQTAQDQQQRAEQDRQELQPKKDAALQALKDARQEQANKRELARVNEQERRNAQRAADAAQKRLKQKEDDKEKLQREIDRLERLLAAAKEEMAKKEDEVGQAQQDTDEATRKAEENDPSVAQGVQDAADNLSRREEELRELQDEDKKMSNDVHGQERDVQRARQAKMAAERAVAQCKSAEGQKRQQSDRAERELEAQAKLVERLEQAEADRAEKRERQQADENELLQMEARLCEQQDALQAKAQSLNDAHRNFADTTGRVARPVGTLPPSITA